MSSAPEGIAGIRINVSEKLEEELHVFSRVPTIWVPLLQLSDQVEELVLLGLNLAVLPIGPCSLWVELWYRFSKGLLQGAVAVGWVGSGGGAGKKLFATCAAGGHRSERKRGRSAAVDETWNQPATPHLDQRQDDGLENRLGSLAADEPTGRKSDRRRHRLESAICLSFLF